MKNIAEAIVLVSALVIVIDFAYKMMPTWTKKYYTQIKQGLMVCGYALRQDKLEDIADIVFEVVKELENTDKTSSWKHYDAVMAISEKLLTKFNITIDEKALDLIVSIAVSFLPETNK